MEKFWKWLLKADAKGLFVASLLLLGGVSAWWSVDFVAASRGKAAEAAPGPSSETQKLESYEPIGIIGFVSNQFAPETLIVPVNPFHPTFEAIVRALSRRKDSAFLVGGFDDSFRRDPIMHAKRYPRPDSAQDDRPSSRKPIVTRRPPKPQVSFAGMMQRPDGSFAAFLSIRTDKNHSRFVAEGDRLGNATVTDSGREGVELAFPDGTRTLLRIGDPPITLDEIGEGQ